MLLFRSSRDFVSELSILPPNNPSTGLVLTGSGGNRINVCGPGSNAWDVSVYKNFPLRLLQFRGEFYNMLNHTQFSGLAPTARFDAAGNQVNTRFGQLTGARSPRNIQFAVSFKF